MNIKIKKKEKKKSEETEKKSRKKWIQLDPRLPFEEKVKHADRLGVFLSSVNGNVHVFLRSGGQIKGSTLKILSNFLVMKDCLVKGRTMMEHVPWIVVNLQAVASIQPQIPMDMAFEVTQEVNEKWFNMYSPGMDGPTTAEVLSKVPDDVYSAGVVHDLCSAMFALPDGERRCLEVVQRVNEELEKELKDGSIDGNRYVDKLKEELKKLFVFPVEDHAEVLPTKPGIVANETETARPVTVDDLKSFLPPKYRNMKTIEMAIGRALAKQGAEYCRDVLTTMGALYARGRISDSVFRGTVVSALLKPDLFEKLKQERG